MGDGELEYLPEGFRESARHNHDAADAADGVARRVRAVSTSATQFGGGGASSFSGVLNGTAGGQARGAERAREQRDALGEGGSAAAGLGVETDELAGTAQRGAVPADPAVRRSVADGM
ncbi:hypothetical protein V1J52_10975 [Streptomyces sp. TRM 70351]|uniref:hypothetical protein n=1 Tax=Streptomyces sp. TRM 70351 TaxID=3116552 RepID=UPI002E7C0D7D|nr:hypothetical protein [Streptomyces sp. TRM 70351]MEE1928713.1 hypothetical protein [Streptomyces sp. TRM 70351]